jgi:hypothetical protein
MNEYEPMNPQRNIPDDSESNAKPSVAGRSGSAGTTPPPPPASGPDSSVPVAK